MNVLLVSVDAKYIHSNLAIRSIQKYVNKHGFNIEISEYTINQQIDYILAEIMKGDLDVIGFSCYIWNIEYINKLVRAIKRIDEEITIILGGPEVGYNSQETLEAMVDADMIICGEGEETFLEVLSAISSNQALDNIKGIVYREGDRIIKTLARPLMNMDALPFVYEDLSDFENRIIYYESSRGCPFSCSYCMSSIEKSARMRSFELVKDELQFFLDNKVKQVKFIDRTFNCNIKHAMNIWRYLHENDNGITNFHFEISADLLDDETIAFLNTVREGIFQFEIGVQSTHPETIRVINRKMDFAKVANNVELLKRGNNIHLHLDLIAGLPYEDYGTFANSFDDVYKLYPEQLQLGFLKVLKGASMHERAEKYGIKYRDYAPYEVLATKALSFKEIGKLKKIEEVLEIYYNSGNYTNVIRYLESYFDSPFIMYEQLSVFFNENNYYGKNHSKTTLCAAIKEFAKTVSDCDGDIVSELIKYDLYLQEKVKKFPDFIEHSGKMRKDVIAFYRDNNNILKYLPLLKEYSSKQVSKMAHIEVFGYDVIEYEACGYKEIKRKETAVLFDYSNRDKMRHNALVYRVDLKEDGLFPGE